MGSGRAINTGSGWKRQIILQDRGWAGCFFTEIGLAEMNDGYRHKANPSATTDYNQMKSEHRS